jgi:hypothetical protein
MRSKLLKLKAEQTMCHSFLKSAGWASLCLTLVFLNSSLRAQNCQTASDLDDATRNAITNAGQRVLDEASKGDTVSMQQNAIPSLASNFSAIAATVKDRQPQLAGGQASVTSLFLLEADGTAPLPNAEFYCGVFGKNGQTANSAVFNLSNLPPGKYGVVILAVTSPKAKSDFSVILQQQGNDWKLGGLYIKPAEVAGHDGDWYLAQARQYKSKGQTHDAWLYYLQAQDMLSPLSFMSTQKTDKLYDEFNGSRPADIPAGGQTAELNAGMTSYKLTSLAPVTVGNDLDLLVRYQVPDASNPNQSYQSNMAVIKALVTKYPELRDAFSGIEARAVDSSHHDYGTLLAMKDVK